MNKIKLISFVAAVVLLSLGSVQPASAYIFGYSWLNPGDVVLTLDGSTSLKATDSGWYDWTGYHDPSNTNYAVESDPYGLHNWFLFDISRLTAPVSYATLTLYSYDVLPGGKYKLFDVTTPIPDLQNATGNGIATFDDLGSGKVYGQRWYSPADTDTYQTITLTSDFLTDFNLAIARDLDQFAIGGRIPEPATLGLFGIGLLGFAASRRRKAA